MELVFIRVYSHNNITIIYNNNYEYNILFDIRIIIINDIDNSTIGCQIVPFRIIFHALQWFNIEFRFNVSIIT